MRRLGQRRRRRQTQQTGEAPFRVGSSASPRPNLQLQQSLALFIHVPDDAKAEKRWVLWTPEGYYAASPGGDDLIGWHVNRGPDQAADFYPAETFRSTFHRPDLVKAALDKVDGPNA